MNCKKCGAHIPDGYKFCMKCGEENEFYLDEQNISDNETDAVCNSKQTDEVQIIKKGRKKKVVIAALIGILIFIAVAKLFRPAVEISEFISGNGLVANIPWGTDMDIVSNELESKFHCKTDLSEGNAVYADIKNINGFKGSVANIICIPDDSKKLYGISISIKTPDDSQLYNMENQLKEYLNDNFKYIINLSEDSDLWKTPDGYITVTLSDEDDSIRISVLPHKNYIDMSV